MQAARRSPLALPLAFTAATLVALLLWEPDTFVAPNVQPRLSVPERKGLTARYAGADPAVKSKPAPEAASLVGTPKEAYYTMVEKGEYTSKMPALQILHQAMMGGVYIGFGALLALTVAGNMSAATMNNPGLGRFMFAALFPVNLLLVLLTGAQLITGNACTGSAALFEGRVTVWELLKNWSLAIVGNIVSCLICAFAAKYCGFLVGGTQSLAVHMAMKKTSNTFGHTLVKAIGANWLVCLAVFLCGQARDMAGKFVGIWFPISTFVAIGMEHSVANMFILPVGVLSGAPISAWQVLIKNWLPAILGNIIGGVVCVAASYSFAYGSLGKH